MWKRVKNRTEKKQAFLLFFFFQKSKKYEINYKLYMF